MRNVTSKNFYLCCLISCFSVLVSVGDSFDLGKEGVDLKITAEPSPVDVGRDFFVTVEVTPPAGATTVLPDLRDRFRGFSVAEDFAEEPLVGTDGRTTYISRWRLVPESVAEKYGLRPFVITLSTGVSFYTAPITFTPPAARESVTGEMEVNPKKDLPPLSWRLVGIVAALGAGAAALVWLFIRLIKKIREMVRVHKMSPIQRAYYELEKLLAKGLPGRGYYKDFYVELTMVVRRYIVRKYGIKAPNMTTEEFLREAHPSDELKQFLESADLVKFAGVEATPEMADLATKSARTYLETDNREVVK